MRPMASALSRLRRASATPCSSGTLGVRRRRAPWHPAPRRWLSAGGCPTPAQPLVCHADVPAVPAHLARLAPRAQALPAPGPARGALPGPRSPPTAEARPGLHACTDSRGARRRPGARTTAGPRQARRARVAGAWASRAPAPGRRPLPRRLAKAPTAVPASRWQAQGRRCKRSRPCAPVGTTPTRAWWPWRVRCGGVCGPWPRRCPSHPQPPDPHAHPATPRLPAGLGRDAAPGGWHPRRRAEPAGRRGPRWRPAPDGRQEGGNQSTASSRITRRLCLAPPLPMDVVQEDEDHAKKSVAHS